MKSHSSPNVFARSIPAAFYLLLTMPFSAVQAEDWTHWRGPSRNDVSAETSGWNGTSWPKKEAWQASVGEGGASPIVVGGRVYLTGWKADQDTLFCLDLASGREIWKQSYRSPRYGRHSVGDKSLYSGASSTPEFDTDTGLIFTLGVDGNLTAWDTAKQGKQIWSLNLYDKYRAHRRPEVAVRKKTQRDYGYVSSPLVLDNQLIVEVGGNRGNIVAFDKQTGKELWSSENRDEAGHTGGPVPITVEGTKCIAVLTLRNLVVTAIEGSSAGRTVAQYKWTTDYGNNIATAAVDQDSVIITSAYNHVAMCRLKITSQGAQKVWENSMASGVCSPLIHNGHIYWAWRGVHCVDYETGQEVWSGGKIASQGSCILTADDRLIIYGNKGDLLLAETAERSPDRYTQLASERIFSKTDAWPHVVLANEHIICRDRSGTVRCFLLSAANR